MPGKFDLENYDQLWFPGLAEHLVSSLEKAIRSSVGQPGRPYEAFEKQSDSSIPATASWLLGKNHIAIEYPSTSILVRFSDLSFSTIRPESSLAQIWKAAEVLGLVDGLVDTLGQLVRTVYLLEAPFGYDVSHSDPELPFSIFISLPQPGETDGVPRLAESILHESMHLQLTMIELRAPLILDDLEGAYSPWKREVRPITGLIHGLYVFAVIHQMCERLVGSQEEWSRYGQRRRAEIEKEVAILPKCPRGLSPIGLDLWYRCRHSVLSSS